MADIPDDGRVSRRSLLIGAAGAAVVLGGGAGAADYEINHHPGLRRRLFGCGSTPPVPPSDYAVTAGSVKSAAMRTTEPWLVALPPDHMAGDQLPLIVVLPGLGGRVSDLTTVTGLPGFATAAKLRVAFACPGGAGDTYYHPRTNGTNSLEFVTEEFLPMIERRFGVGGSRGNRAIYGISMGGFGSLLVAQQRPDLVCAAVGSSPAVFTTYRSAITGHPYTFDSEADWERWGLWTDLDTLDKVPIRVDCGNADPFAGVARQLLARVPGAVGHIGPGCHTAGFWRRNAITQLRFLAHHLRS